jgi:hypothetical protein
VSLERDSVHCHDMCIVCSTKREGTFYHTISDEKDPPTAALPYCIRLDGLCLMVTTVRYYNPVLMFSWLPVRLENRRNVQRYEDGG